MLKSASKVPVSSVLAAGKARSEAGKAGCYMLLTHASLISQVVTSLQSPSGEFSRVLCWLVFDIK